MAPVWRVVCLCVLPHPKQMNGWSMQVVGVGSSSSSSSSSSGHVIPWVGGVDKLQSPPGRRGMKLPGVTPEYSNEPFPGLPVCACAYNLGCL
ncbi:hypothetical protein FJTKL_00150 [Diaporthe vaccinii]|uniref:Secreted protein n=1 Tax=Diaporthe vaccinii TaxID=105482 RepID=A0ABR4E4H8_9PEZI